MDSPPGTSHGTSQPGPLPGLSVPDAAAALGVSTNTVRRWIKDGSLVAERVARPQGYALRVYLPTQVPPVSTSPGTSFGMSHDEREVPPTGTSQQVPTVAPTDLQRAEALAAYGATLLAPVVAELAAVRQQAVERAEEVGRLREQLQVAAARIAALEAPAPRDEPVPTDGGSPHPWWSRLAAWWRR
jgi:excisionase family DNA binding protein